MGFELTTLVVIGTDCTGSCKSNYHTIMITTMTSQFSIRFWNCSNNVVFFAFILFQIHSDSIKKTALVLMNLKMWKVYNIQMNEQTRQTSCTS